MFGFQHPCYILEIVQVCFLRAAGWKGYSNDSFSDVSQVEFITFLHNVIKACTSVEDRACLRGKKIGGEKQKVNELKGR